MKKIKLIIAFILFVPIIINAKSYSYDEAIKKANNYIYTFNEYRDYIELNDMKYDFDGKTTNHVKFKNGGFLSEKEFKITNSNGSSYLASGLSYWTLTQSSFNKNYVVEHSLKELELNKKTGVKVTEFVRNEAKISGSGTKSDPWHFQKVLSINLTSKAEERATLSNERCSDISQGEDKITILMYDQNDAPFDICESPYFRFYAPDSSCKEYIKYDEAKDLYYISGITQDNTSCNLEFVHRTHKITLTKCDGCTPNTSPTPIYLSYDKTGYFRDDIGRKTLSNLDTLPSKTGYSFEGYYTEESGTGEKIIDKNGNFVSKNIDANTTLSPYMRAHTYDVIYNCNGGTGTTETTNHTYDKKQKLRNIGCKKDGYIFKGWSDSSTGSVKYTNQYETGPGKNLVTEDKGEITLYAVWEACPAGKYNNTGSLTCTNCEAGTYSNSGSSTCIKCPAGKFNNKSGSSKCDECTPGYYCTGGTNRVQCQEGYSSLKGASTNAECRAYRCASGTLTDDDEKGYVCVKKADEKTYKCSCQTCKDPYTCVTSQNCGTYTTQTYTYTDSCPQSGTCITKHTVCVNATCSVTRVETNYETCTKWYSCTKTGTKQVYNPAPCYGTCYGSPYECNCKTCYSYSCPSGWNAYSGSESTLKCYVPATIG